MSDLATNQNFELFLTRDQIQQRVQQLGAEISREFAGQSLVQVGILHSTKIILADLARAITVDCTFDFISISSYGEDLRSSGTVRLIKNIDQTIESRNVILVEDILDTGVTLYYLQSLWLAQNPAAFKIAAKLSHAQYGTMSHAAVCATSAKTSVVIPTTTQSTIKSASAAPISCSWKNIHDQARFNPS